jgi:hypothetical protein
MKLSVTNGNETYKSHPKILIPVSCNCVSEVYNLYRTKVTFAVTQVEVKCLKNSGRQWT